MSEEAYQNSELGQKLAKTLHDIKEDIQEYIKDNFVGKTRVVFTIKDRHVQDDGYLAWRYWIGLDKNDLNEVGDLKEKIYAFLGHGDDDFRDNYQPCTFEQGISVSGKVLPGKNWMLLQTPDSLEDLKGFKIPNSISATTESIFDKMMMYPYYHHADFGEEQFKAILNNFFKEIFENDENGSIKLKDKYCHKKKKDERKQKLIDFNIAAKKALQGFKVDEINKFSMHEKKVLETGKYFRYLMRAIDYYFIFKGYQYLLSYGLVVGGYHLLTFYILIDTKNKKDNVDKLLSNIDNEKRKELFDRHKKDWLSIDGAFDMWRVAGCPKFKDGWEDFSNFTNFLGEIDSIIKIGWTDTISAVLNEIGNKAALKGENLETVVSECISHILFLANPAISGNSEENSQPKHCRDKEGNNGENIQCRLCKLCVHDDLKFLVAVDKGEEHFCEHKDGDNCIHITEKIDGYSGISGKGEIDVVFRKFNEDGDKSSAKVTLKRLVTTFASQYVNVIVPTRINILKTAIISILVDSYAHNISAHSLSALEWWFSNRSKFLGRRIFVGDGELSLTKLLPSEISVSEKERKDTTEKYYEALDLTDSTYDAKHYSLFDYLQFTKDDKNLFIFSEKVNDSKTEGDFNPRFPVSVDYAIAPFMRFLKDKGAFWSGVTRDMAFGGESKTLYEVLWEDFANNPLYLGTIAFSEGISKLNIYLALEKDGKRKNGRFVSIDLSVIEYENQLANPKKNTEKVSNSDENEIEASHGQKVDNNCESENNKTNVNFIEFDKYSQYGFVRLGECFSYFREELSKDEYKIFLPGGVIGEHALFTIIENTIRNIKHYKDNKEQFNEIQKNGINLCISIQDENNARTDKKSTRLKLGVWLNHITSLKAKVKDSNGKTVDKKIIEIMKEKAVGSIIDDMGMPRMGGNSQDKACAAMLFNNNFMSVEMQDTKLQEAYYPWITFEEDPIDGEQGVLKKYFTVWKSEDIYKFEGDDINDLREKFKEENIARFKFFASENKVSEEMKVLLRENGIIRILENVKVKGRDNKIIADIYKEWLEKWCKVKFEDNQQFTIFRAGDEGKGTGSPKAAIWMKDNVLVCNYQDIFPFNNFNENNFEISHGKEQDYHCNVRSHGKFIQKFFRKDINQFSKIKMNVNENGDIIDDSEKREKNEALLLEFIETVKTKIVIFDDRVNGRFSVYNEGKRKMFKEQLFLEVYPEKYSKFKEYKKEAKDINILIMHLSFIENLKDRSGRKYSEERIVNFIKDELAPDQSNRNLPENFIFVITSGRGRDAWNSAIRNSAYSKNTLFKPIESILNAVNAGISYNDHFDVKYNLVKAIFGS